MTDPLIDAPDLPQAETFEEQLLRDLNPAQRQAVTHDGGPLLIVAGAGSGKTRVLTHRIAHLIRARKVNPFSILAITFTNKAAGEMKERVGQLVGERLGGAMWVMTFHSACVRILRREGVRLGYKSTFTIYDDSDSERLIAYCLRDLDIDAKRFPPRTIKAAIGRAKDEMVDEEMFAARADNFFDKQVADVYQAYQARLRQAQAMDFDDLILNVVHLFRLFPDALAAYQDRFQHVMIDEFQDTNGAQFELARLLAQRDRNICVVGDADQSVYAFRGADFRNVLRFEDEFPDARVIVLEQNYRSTQTILDAANAVIDRNMMRKPKNLWSDQGAGVPITRFHAESEQDEAMYVARAIEQLREEDEGKYGDIAIFYRTNAQSRAIEEVFTRYGVPYRVIGSLRFYDRKEIKDAMAYLRLSINPSDEVSLKRVINTPKRGIGDQTVAVLERFAREAGLSISEAVDEVDAIDLAQRARSAVGGFGSIMRVAREMAEANASPAEVLQQVLDSSAYIAELEAEKTVEAQGRVENLQELVGVADAYVRDNPEGGVRGFLEQVALVSDADEVVDDEGAVTMMTLHIAKGLEFPVVFITGMEEGVFPHMRSMTDPGQLEEERRLCYVGITRAKERLFLTHAWSRSLWGGTNYNPPSRFLHEIPEHLVVVAGEEAEEGETELVRGKAGPGPAITVSVGEEVFHERWGRGVVVAVAGQGSNAEVTVHFADEGQKRLLLAYAPLKKT
ncbi:MAG: DNA helicase PcrA [Actinobacteria bacterium]|nr:MAG: DNA helicase PcrA [Actinomycetota bacterium]